MSKHLNTLRRQLTDASIVAVGEAMGAAVAVTNSDLVIAKAKLFGGTLQRFPLDALDKIQTIRNPAANVLQIDFRTTPPSSVTLMYKQDALPAFQDILRLLEGHLPSTGL